MKGNIVIEPSDNGGFIIKATKLETLEPMQIAQVSHMSLTEIGKLNVLQTFTARDIEEAVQITRDQLLRITS